MKFKATIDQIKQIACNAINASIPMGMGHAHYQAGDFSPNDLQMEKVDHVNMDYIGGRMVKLIIRIDGNMWHIPNGSICNPDKEYQSWAAKYPTYKSLLLASGISEQNILMEG